MNLIPAADTPPAVYKDLKKFGLAAALDQPVNEISKTSIFKKKITGASHSGSNKKSSASSNEESSDCFDKQETIVDKKVRKIVKNYTRSSERDSTLGRR